MSLIQSAINQIGRELGRDIYRGNFSRKFNSPTYGGDVNDSILGEINNFKLASYDKVSLRQLANLLELSDKVNPNSFSWEEPYIELDSKIDFAKEHLDKEHLEAIEGLDLKNSQNYSKAKQQHKKFIESEVKVFETLVNEFKEKNGLVAFLLSLVGLGRLHFRFNIGILLWHLIVTAFAICCAYYGWLMFKEPTSHHGNSPIETEKQIDAIKNVGIVIMSIGGLVYLLVIIAVLSKFSGEKKRFEAQSNYLKKLIEYQGSLK